MANSVNKVILVGNLGKDPEVRSFSNGGKVVNFSVATSESWKDKTTGEWKDRTEWNKVAVFNEHLAGQAEKYLRKGSKVYIEGQLQTRKWADKDGRDQYTTEVVLKGYDAKLVDLTPRQGGASGGRSADEDYGQYGGYGGGSSSGSGNAGAGSSPNWNSDDDGEMPF